MPMAHYCRRGMKMSRVTLLFGRSISPSQLATKTATCVSQRFHTFLTDSSTDVLDRALPGPSNQGIGSVSTLPFSAFGAVSPVTSPRGLISLEEAYHRPPVVASQFTSSHYCPSASRRSHTPWPSFAPSSLFCSSSSSCSASSYPSSSSPLSSSPSTSFPICFQSQHSIRTKASITSLTDSPPPVTPLSGRSSNQQLSGQAFRQKSGQASTASASSPADTATLSTTAQEATNLLRRQVASGGRDPLNLDDAQALFARLTTSELAGALLNLELAANEMFVDFGTAVLRSPLMKSKLLSAPVLGTVKRTSYAHFCAGETVEEAAKTLQRMWELGLRGILDFSVEDAHDSAMCDKNLEGFLRTIRQSAVLPEGSVSFACVKITALCPLPTLTRMSSLIRRHHFDPSSPPPPWLLPSLPVLTSDSPRYHDTAAGPNLAPLLPEEERQVAEAYARLQQICRACEEQQLPLLVDAEYTSVEPAIDHLAYAAALEFNRPSNSNSNSRIPSDIRGSSSVNLSSGSTSSTSVNNKNSSSSSSSGSSRSSSSSKPSIDGCALVYSTVQCYLKDSRSRLEAALTEAQKRGIPFGVKLVRGAYLTSETAHAKKAGEATGPIHASIEETHRCYDGCAALLLEAAAKKSTAPVSAVLATHNYGSGRAAVLKAAELGLPVGSPHLHFAQLKGMADGLSLGLAFAGYPVSKYLPYGPVAEVLPYLMRRAEENRGVLGNTGAERRRIRNELSRRLKASVGLK
eukprot:TRINITY_DN528_c0_g2_i1.p1 TRINITY_DN528_c0_g2~~TRINITY_DN528_c0_g2_i1.p1  ORF type:complete len:745 (+),score=104.35 TRINITY_DN528_c0_g2_i1:620-2854(+)